MDGVLLGRKSAEAAARFFSQPEKVHPAFTQPRRTLPPPQFGVVTVKNALGRDLTRYSAVCIGNPTPTGLGTEPAELYSLINPSLKGQRAGYNADDPILGILQEDIADGDTGLAQIAGVTPAYFRWDEAGTSTAGAWADISDADDKLTFSNFGPIRVLQRNVSVGSTTASKVWMVELGTDSSLGSTNWTSNVFTWNAEPAWDYGNIWSVKLGDAIRVGLYQIGTTTTLRLGRVGRFDVVVQWYFTGGTWSTGDRLSYRVRWPGISGSYLQQFGEFTPSAFGGLDGYAMGERSFYFNHESDSPASDIPIPGITVVKIPASGSNSSVTVTGGIRVRVVRFGGSGFHTVWPESQRDAMWGRSASGAPLGSGFAPPEGGI